MQHQLPRTQVFHYTTLFRSKTHFSLCAVNQFLAGDAIAHRRNGLETLDIDFLPTIEALAKCAQEINVKRLEAERKSTRLNSSHVRTSYAVFCMKKKNYTPEP